jgi:UDP-N-acetylmuramoyl-L-alanyl-D-glutamate--2,6-diaminopimelate ligase
VDLTPLIKEGVLIPVNGIQAVPNSVYIDSRLVKEGGLFVAIPGYKHDGAVFVNEALSRGASAIVAPQGAASKMADYFKDKYPRVSFFETPEIRKTASLLASQFYPKQPETIVAVTGTNGKTSVVSFIRQIWDHLGLPAASLGTLGLIIEGQPLPPPTGSGGINTPDYVMLHQILQNLKEQGVEHLAFEASSHGLHQHRLDSVRLKAAVFTNFTNDHLDYHHTLEGYFEAESRLFQEVMGPGTHAILNTDIPEYEKLKSVCDERKIKTITFGKNGEAIRLVSLVPGDDNQDVYIEIEGKSYNFILPLVGQFQVYNVMAALGAVISCGGQIDTAVDACVNLKVVPGRLELASPGIYVDYSHTPDALAVALKALRPHTKGKLWVLFGCGGNRDAFKRPVMGEIADQLADNIIITDDNPRDEDPAKIRKQILAKCPRASEIPSRHEAIVTAVNDLKQGDVLLIAGKGHETYQLIGDQVLPFNDVEEVQKCIRK